MVVRKRNIPWKKVAPYLFCMPFYIAFLAVYLYPFIQTVIMSFQNVNLMGKTKFIGFNNYVRLFNTHFFSSVSNTFFYTLFFIALEIPLALLFAVALNRKDCFGRSFFKSALFIPILASTVIVGVLFRLMFGSSDASLINSILIRLGVLDKGINWLLSSKALGILVLVCVSIWRNTGINMVFFLSGLQNVSPELYDAAKIDGAGSAACFRYVTLPGIKPTLIYVLTMSVMNSFAMFSESYVLWKDATVGDIGKTIVRYLYEMGFYKGSFGMASATGIVLLVVVMLINAGQLRAFGLFKEN